MGFVERLMRRSMELTLTSERGWNQIYPGYKSHVGVDVTPDTAMKFPVVYSCVKVLAESIGSLPGHWHERVKDGKDLATGFYLNGLLRDEPNHEMTAQSFWECTVANIELRGNGLAEVERTRGQRVKALWPIPCQCAIPKRVDGRIVYDVNIPTEMKLQRLKSELVLHVPGLSFNGLWGLSPIQYAMQSVGIGLAAEEYGARFFGDGAVPQAILEHPGELGSEAHESLKKDIQEQIAGLSKSHRLLILEEGMKWEKVGITPNEAQFLETRKHQVTEVCRIFRMPPHMVADLERSTFSNIEHQAIEFVVYSLLPRVKRIEQSVNRRLLNPTEKERYFWEWDLNGLMRGDVKARYEAYAIARVNGWMSANDIRRLENMPPLPSQIGDMYLVPMNMNITGTAPTSRMVETVAEGWTEGNRMAKGYEVSLVGMRLGGNGSLPA